MVMPSSRKITNMIRKRKKRNLAIAAAVPAIPVNPRIPATTEIMRNINAHFNILHLRYPTFHKAQLFPIRLECPS